MLSKNLVKTVMTTDWLCRRALGLEGICKNIAQYSILDHISLNTHINLTRHGTGMCYSNLLAFRKEILLIQRRITISQGWVGSSLGLEKKPDIVCDLI